MVSSLLVGPPTLLLGMVSPYAIKLAAGSLSSLGVVAGNLYSLSTVGSIAGTFGTVFLLIPSMDVRSIIGWLGVALLAVSLHGLGWGPRAIFVLTFILVLSPLTPLLTGGRLRLEGAVYEKETPYSRLEVVDAGGVRTLYMNGLPHSAMYLDGSSRLVFTYTRYFAMGFVFNGEIRDVLFVGGGGFSGPKKFLADHPDVRVDVVEIDPDVIEVARVLFNLRDDPRLTVYNEDGRTYLARTSKRYDLIVLDAYAKTYVPFHLMTLEFFETLSRRLSDRGVVVSNLISSLVGDTSDLFWAEYKTASRVFPGLYVFPTSDYGAGWVQNVILVASKDQRAPSKEVLAERALGSGRVDPSEMVGFLSRLWDGPARVENVPLLTDSFAPVEMLLNPVTGRPYVLEAEYRRERPSLAAWSENAVVVAALAAVAVVWVLFGIPSHDAGKR